MQAAEVSSIQSQESINAWAIRPGDHVFNSVENLVEHTKKLKDKSFIADVASEHLKFSSTGESMAPGHDGMNLGYIDKEGEQKIALLNNHSFNQACNTIGGRASEYKKYPAALAQVMLTWLAQNSARADAKLLVTEHDDESWNIRAVTSPTYGRIWNHDVAEAVHKHVDPEIWTVPKSSYFHTKHGFITTNDRKVFIFQVNEKNPIELKGYNKPLYRGFYAWNSDVGDGTGGYADFLFNAACANRIISGMDDFEEFKIRHTSGAPNRWFQEAVPRLKEWINTSTDKIRAHLEASRKKKVARNEKGALDWLKQHGFTRAMSKAAIDAARTDESGADVNASPFALFNVVQGLTYVAQEKRNNDERVEIEQRAGKLMRAFNFAA